MWVSGLDEGWSREKSESIATLLSNLDADQEEIDTLRGELDVAKSALKSASDSKKELIIELSVLKTELSKFKNTVTCSGFRPDINYTSNATVSNSIKSWLEDREDSIDKKEWDIIWNIAWLSIHRLYGDYLWKYIVYFEDSDLDFKESVFDVTNQCWHDMVTSNWKDQITHSSP